MSSIRDLSRRWEGLREAGIGANDATCDRLADEMAEIELQVLGMHATNAGEVLVKFKALISHMGWVLCR